jgi:hypothetical protein
MDDSKAKSANKIKIDVREISNGEKTKISSIFSINSQAFKNGGVILIKDYGDWSVEKEILVRSIIECIAVKLSDQIDEREDFTIYEYNEFVKYVISYMLLRHSYISKNILVVCHDPLFHRYSHMVSHHVQAMKIMLTYDKSIYVLVSRDKFDIPKKLRRQAKVSIKVYNFIP